jgi:regulator of protease activity HflC (stomatin/prohibitin superfamily)
MPAGVDGALAWILAVGVVLAGVVLAMIRVIPEYERALVVRLGRVSRVRGPGVLAVLPVVERLVRVGVRESRLDSIVVRAPTRDSVSVWVTVAAYFRVVEPVRAYVAVPNVHTRTAEAIELAVRAEVARTDLKDLAHSWGQHNDRLLNETNSIVAQWGTQVRGIEIVSIDLQLSSELLHWAERLRRHEQIPRQRAS